MPRSPKLTFQKGSNGRAGRWKKQYQGKTYYLGSGNSKSDHKSYQKAFATWARKKDEIDAASAVEAKPNDDAYGAVINEWELVLGWAVEHGDSDAAERARSQLAGLRQRRDLPNQPPISFYDRLESWFRIPPDFIAKAARIDPFSDPDWKQLLIDDVESRKSGLTEKRKVPDALEATPVAPQGFEPESTASFKYSRNVDPWLESEIRWKDRIETQQHVDSEIENDSLGTWIETFLKHKQKRISVGRYTSLEKTLNSFRTWYGAATSVHSITSRTLSDFRSAQLDLAENGTYSTTYMRDRLSAAKSFVRWLWEQEVIDKLPRNFDSRELQIACNVTTPQIFDVDEIKTLVTAAKGKTKLYVLLALNSGMTQKDIANLQDDEIDWNHGRLTRKRSKTQRFERVPTVQYKLWPEVIELLKRFRSGSDRVLLNSNGEPLHQEYLDDAGKHKKNDNIKNAYERVKRKLSLNKSFGKLRKTSASLIESDPRYRGLDELFLGHAPSSVAKRHYVATSDDALDEALDFLRSKYEIGKLDEDDEQSTQQASQPEAAETSPA